MTFRAALFLLVAAGCAAPPDPGPDVPAADRVADFTPLRIGQPYLGGALEVTRFRSATTGNVTRFSVAIANRSGSALRLRWRFRYVDGDGWERRTRDSAAWREATLAAGEEWAWEGESAVAETAAVGMDWRLEK